jgi:non-heme Fe2+,alpha-ketoglutarate-dependent halogenase
MPALTQDQISQFRRDGFLFPIRVMPTEEAAGMRQRLEAVEAERGSLTGKFRSLKTHLLITWLDALVRRPEILDPIESLIGPDILCWSTAILIKEPGDGTHVSWHQDLQYWGLEPGDVVSAWLAVSPATVQSGCMQMLAGSHEWDDLEHQDTEDDKNLLSRGQTITAGIDESLARHLVLEPGEISLHHGNTAHASDPNTSDDRRIGIAIRYMAAHVRPMNGADSALLVRGQDRHGHFMSETSPVADFDAAAQAEHDRIMELRHKVMLERSAS